MNRIANSTPPLPYGHPLPFVEGNSVKSEGGVIVFFRFHIPNGKNNIRWLRALSLHEGEGQAPKVPGRGAVWNKREVED